MWERYKTYPPPSVHIQNISLNYAGSANILYEIKFIKWIKHYNNNSLHKRR